MTATLDRESWPKGYAQLVEYAGKAKVGSGPGEARAWLDRGEVERAIVLDTDPASDGSSSGHITIEWTEVAQVIPTSQHPDAARLFLDFLVERRRARPLEKTTDDAERRPSSQSHVLLADLLGATLVDAQPELRAAWAALERAGRPASALRWIIEPPPWPPKSVESIQLKEPEQAMDLIETLAGEISPEPDLRAAIVRSWLAPPRLIDGAFLDALGQESEGRLLREPRFRAGSAPSGRPGPGNATVASR